MTIAPFSFSIEYLLFCSAVIVIFVAISEFLLRKSLRPIIVAVAAVAMLLTLLVGSAFSQAAETFETNRVKNSLRAVAPTYAQSMKESGHASIDTSTPSDDQTYLKLIRMQRKMLEINPVVADIYTMRPNPDGGFNFIVDSETDYDRSGAIDDPREERTEIGYVYEIEDTDALRRSMAGEYVFDGDIYTDKWGTWVSATCPIFDDEGKVEAILGVDYSAAEWIATIRRARMVSIALFGSLSALILSGYVGTGLLLINLERRKRTEAQLVIANGKARAAARTKDAFLINMSHELRTPLTAVMGFAELLQDSTSSHDQRLVASETIHRNGQNLLQVVNSVLEFTRLEGGEVTPNLADVSPLTIASAALQSARTRAGTSGVQIRLTTDILLPQTIHSDEDRLRQILDQLLNNAIKFTGSGSIELALNYLEINNKKHIEFVVSDTGIGMDDAVLSKLFKPFEQADSSLTRQFSGMGLGLAISQRQAGVIGGTIRASSTVGKGSRLALRIDLTNQKLTLMPVIGASRIHQSDTARQSQPLKNLLIMVVDDAADNRALLTRLLGKLGANILTAENGQIAFNLLTAPKTGQVDLVLMDMQMPELDGYSAATQLRAAGLSLPIIAITAHSMPGDRQRCIAAGCDDYATKPVDRVALCEMILRLTKDGPHELRKAS